MIKADSNDMDTAAHTDIGNPSHNSLAEGRQYSDTVRDANRQFRAEGCSLQLSTVFRQEAAPVTQLTRKRWHKSDQLMCGAKTAEEQCKV